MYKTIMLCILLIGVLTLWSACSEKTSSNVHSLNNNTGTNTENGTIHGPKEGTFHFLILGDRTGGHVPGEFQKFVDEVNRLNPDVVINVGDMIEGYTKDVNELTSQWEEYVKIVKGIKAMLMVYDSFTS